jgi:hypothetical protein
MPLVNVISLRAATVWFVRLFRIKIARPVALAATSTFAVSEAAFAAILLVIICTSLTRAWFHASKDRDARYRW